MPIRSSFPYVPVVLARLNLLFDLFKNPLFLLSLLSWLFWLKSLSSDNSYDVASLGLLWRSVLVS